MRVIGIGASSRAEKEVTLAEAQVLIPTALIQVQANLGNQNLRTRSRHSQSLKLSSTTQISQAS